MSFGSKPVRPPIVFNLAQGRVIRKDESRRGNKAEMKLYSSFRSQVSSPFPSLTQQTDDPGIAVIFPVACLDGGYDREHKPGNTDSNGHGDSDADKPEQQGDSQVDAVGNLEIQHFLARGINGGALRALEKPDDQRDDDMCERKAENKPREAREMQADAPGSIRFGNEPIRRWAGRRGLGRSRRRRGVLIERLRSLHKDQRSLKNGAVQAETIIVGKPLSAEILVAKRAPLRLIYRTPFFGATFLCTNAELLSLVLELSAPSGPTSQHSGKILPRAAPA